MNIAIDGPSGAGKSTIAKILAEKMGIVYLDTGAMYRAIGLKTHNSGVDSLDEEGILKVLDECEIGIVYSEGLQKVMLNGADVSQEIRQHHISKYASDVSKIKQVRIKMVELQRVIAQKGDTVLDGRDIGSFVLPNAEYKFFLTAEVSERAKRRYDELIQKGVDTTLEQIEKDIAERDYNDMNRDFAPLVKADDAIEIDSTHMTIEQVVDEMMSIIKK